LAPLPALIALGAIIRLNMVLWQPLIYPDSMQYMHLAREIRSGTFFEADYDLDRGFIKSRRLPPFYSLLLSPFAGTPADLEKVGIVLSLLLSLYTFIPIYYAALMAFSRREAIIAGALFAFHPFVNKFASPILSEATFTAIFVSLIALTLWSFRRPAVWRFAAAGALCALAYLTRDVGITAVAVAAAGIAVKFGLIDRRPGKQVSIYLAALFAAFLLLSAPYFVHIRMRTGQWGLTVQMSNTSITEQVQLAGGDRFDRDRMSVRDKPTRLLGGKPAQGFSDLLALTPLLAVKTARNVYQYAAELVRKGQSMPLIFFLLGLLAVGLEFRRGRDRERLLRESWPAVWVFQLLLLYAFVTPYMVDIRYLYPLLGPLLLLSARGMTATADWAWQGAHAPEKTARGPAALAAGLALGYYLLVPLGMDEEAYAKLDYLFGSWGPIRYLFPVLSCALFLGLVSVPGLARAGAKINKLPPVPLALIGAALALAGLALAGAIGLRREFYLLLPGELLAALGLSLLLLALARRTRSSAGLAAALVAANLLFITPDFIFQWNWFSSSELFAKYASGYREAAQEMKSLGLAPPGKVICARKPFIAYYLDGVWYLDQNQEPIPKRESELKELIRQGKIDFLALDSFTLKTLRPTLTELSLGIEPIPGATMIYSRYFPEYERIITVYDCRRSEPPPTRRAGAADYFTAAADDARMKRFPFALRELQAGLQLDPNNADAWFMVLSILRVYYDCVARGDVPSLALAPHLLPALQRASENYLRLNPDNEMAKMNLRQVSELYQREQSDIQRLKSRKNGFLRDDN
jgi:hypothetical protein